MNAHSQSCIDETKRLLESQELVMGKSSKQVADTLKKLSQIHFLDGQYDEAENCLMRAIDIKSQIYGHRHEELLPLLELLATQYDQQGRRIEKENIESCQTEIRHRMNAPTRQQVVALPIAKPVVATAVIRPREAAPIPLPGPHASEVSSVTVESSCERFALRKGSLWIGRDKINDVAFPNDPSVESSHAMIAFEDGCYWIVNRATAAATTLNGKQVTKKSKLNVDDLIQIGDVTLRVT